MHGLRVFKKSLIFVLICCFFINQQLLACEFFCLRPASVNNSNTPLVLQQPDDLNKLSVKELEAKLQNIKLIKLKELNKLTPSSKEELKDLAGRVAEMGDYLSAVIQKELLGNGKKYGNIMEKFMLFSAGPGTGKDYVFSKTFGREKEKNANKKWKYPHYTDGSFFKLVEKLILYHSRPLRTKENEKDGWEYNFDTRLDHNRINTLENKGKIKTATVNRQLQGMAINGFDEKGVVIENVINPADFKAGDKVTKTIEFLDGENLKQDVLVKRQGFEQNLKITTGIKDDEIGDGKPGVFIAGDIIEEVSHKDVTVKRPVKGIMDIIDGPKLGVVEVGYGWFRMLTGPQSPTKDVFKIFIAPFDEKEMRYMTNARKWIERRFTSYNERAYAHLYISYKMQEAKKELSNFKFKEIRELKKDIKERLKKLNKDEDLIEKELADIAGKVMESGIKKFGSDKQTYANRLLEYAKLIEKEDFIVHLNERLESDFGDPNGITDVNQIREARLLAYEINRRTLARDRAVGLSNDDKQPVEYDRYNRLLEGIIQIMHRNEYAQKGGFVVINRWVFDQSKQQEYDDVLKIQFAGAFFSNLIGKIQEKIKSPSAGIVPERAPDYDEQYILADGLLRYFPEGIINVPAENQAVIVYSDSLAESAALQDIIRKSSADGRKFYLVNKQDSVSAEDFLRSLNIDRDIFESNVFLQNSLSADQLALNIAAVLNKNGIRQGRVFASAQDDLIAWSRQGLIEALVMLLKDKKFEIISDYSQQHTEYIRTHVEALKAA
ncbi:MAG: hypothetical protein PHV77_03810 [Candidatus Omnitrophica bacterium]|jgi:uncharacterized protein YicC (UPF0701 family)|nr:hypothetical protein [Candidatus Omnitrophota bacterium]